MSIFQFIFYLGIINIIFGFVWKWVFVIPSSFLFALLKVEKGIYFLKAFGSYLLVSLTAIATFIALKDNISVLSLIFFPFVGALTLYMGYASNYYEASKQAAMEYDYELMEALRYDSFFMIGSLVLYIIILFVPPIAINPLNRSLFNIINWVYKLPVIGWLVGIGGILFLISMIWYSVLASGFLIGSLFGKIKKEPYVNKDIIIDSQIIPEGIDIAHKSAFVNTKDHFTALMEAAEKGDIATVKALLEIGADVNAKNETDVTPLMCAALYGHTATVLVLLNNGAKVNTKQLTGITALMYAAGQNHIATVEALLNKGANVNAKNKFGGTALIFAAT